MADDIDFDETVQDSRGATSADLNHPFEIYVNDELVWSSEGDTILVSEIEINTPRGQAAKVGVPTFERRLDLRVVPTSLSNLPLHVVDELKKRAAQDGNARADALIREFGASELNPTATKAPVADETPADEDEISL